MSFLWTDLRYAWRTARRSPGVTLAIIAMLALGTGGATAIFTPIYSQIFAPLSFSQPEQLVIIGGDIPLFNSNYNRFERREELDRVFSNLTSYMPLPATIVTIPDTGKHKVIYVVDVNEDFFETLGVPPLRGSDFRQSKEIRTTVISNRFWRNELMRADDAIGKLIDVYGETTLIIGIMPETFDFPISADIWTYRGPIRSRSDTAKQYFLGRLMPGMSPDKAAEELRAFEFKSGSGLRGNEGPVLQSLKTVLYGERRPMLWMLGAAAGLFLLLVCAGVMNLLVTQGARRKSEMAMRQVLGATRWSLILQLLCETLPLVIVGTLAGLWLSEIANGWLLAQFPALKGGEVVIPVKMIFFAILILTVTIIGGLTPALYASSVDLNTHLKSGSDFKRRFFSLSLRELLVGVQLRFALALLTGLVSLVSSLMFHVDVPIGWSSHDMVVVRAEFPIAANVSEDATRYAMLFQEVQNRLNTMPEVANTGIFYPIPFSVDAVRVSQSSWDVRPHKEYGTASAQIIKGYANPEGFEMLEIPLIAGRHFSQMDVDNGLAFRLKLLESAATKGVATNNSVGGVVIVNQSLARQFWPGENAKNVVGKIIYDMFSNSYEVIGIVRDFHLVSDNEKFVPAVYYPVENFRLSQTFLVKLHSGDLIEALRQRLSSFDAGFATIEVQSLGEVVSESTANIRMTLQLLGCFALMGIVIAGLSAYTITSLMVASMNREIGIRMALGKQTWDIFKFVLWRGMRAIIFGLPFGLFLAWILSRILSNFLSQVNVNDPLAWVVSCIVLIVITTVAALIPALRVIRINPLDALRNE